MKFGKLLKRKNVPEWTNAYMDYKGLKIVLREVAQCRQPSGSPIVEAEELAIDVSVTVCDHGRFYETNFLKQSEGGGEIEARFFKKLDEELNKVIAFFKCKVEEAMQEANSLAVQIDASTALAIKVERPGSSSGSRESSDIKGKGIGAPHRTSQDESCRDPANVCKQDTLEILDRMKKILASPVSKWKSFFGDSRDKLKFIGEEPTVAMGRLRVVFIDFYRKLYQLNQFSLMNRTAFSKILKKYEKVSKRRAKSSYMEIVDDSDLVHYDKEVTNLLKRVEDAFITHFYDSNRRKAMASLRPKAKKESHKVTFFTGFFCSCSVALVVAIILTMEGRNLMGYMENVLPLYSLFGYIILHMLTYAANIYFWRLYRVNYPFIFGFEQGTELGYRDVFLLSTGIAVLALACFLANLQIGYSSNTRDLNLKTVTEIVPLVLVGVVLAIIICPLNIVYRSSRIFFMRSILHCIFAPFFKVTLPDFFLADHLTSQVQTIRCLEIYYCYYGLEEYSQRQKKCHNNSVYNTFYFVLAVIPFSFRFLQCMRRVREEKDDIQAFNALKYFFTITSVLIRTAFEMTKGSVWFALAILSSTAATFLNIFWDLVMDWGLLRKKSNNFYLRDKLLVPHKSVYYIAMSLNVFLRLAWVKLLVELFELEPMHQMALTVVVSCLEILRRGIWSFFRLENEHLNNVGKYRAFNSVPHPFYYDEDDQDS